MNLQPGDVVELKSGSPAMTIEWIEDDNAYCVWFDGKKQDGKRFRVTSLKPSE